jgi:hypothetical protein
MTSTETTLPPAGGAEWTDLFLDRMARWEAGRRRDDWRSCIRANRAVAGALHHAEEAEAHGDHILADIYLDQARRRASVASRLLDRYDSVYSHGIANRR